MTKMTREAYEAQGVAAARSGSPMTTLREGTWQRRAWMDGYNSIMLRYATRPTGKSIIGMAAEVTTALRFHDRWPPSAREHALKLLEDMKTERNAKRMQRLVRAIQRMSVRHDPRPNVTMPPQVWVDECTNIPQTHQNDPQRTESTSHEQ
jgi:hypothetical protein